VFPPDPVSTSHSSQRACVVVEGNSLLLPRSRSPREHDYSFNGIRVPSIFPASRRTGPTSNPALRTGSTCPPRKGEGAFVLSGMQIGARELGSLRSRMSSRRHRGKVCSALFTFPAVLITAIVIRCPP